MPLSIPNDLESRKARKALNRLYRRYHSWRHVAEHLKLPNAAHARKIALGQLACTAPMRAALTRLSPRTMRRFIRKVAVPFLKTRLKSPRGVYGRGGVPL